jgi:hypothetical protein
MPEFFELFCGGLDFAIFPQLISSSSGNKLNVHEERSDRQYKEQIKINTARTDPKNRF